MSSTTAEAPARRNVVGPSEVAEMFDVSHQTVLNWIKSGDLPKPIRVGRVIRWKRSTIDALLEGQATA